MVAGFHKDENRRKGTPFFGNVFITTFAKIVKKTVRCSLVNNFINTLT